uniref:Uncharacterized protein n=1 Tax=Rhizophora mucronata TaxID=61149 RepID=A0A2P2PVS2_RHIMU
MYQVSFIILKSLFFFYFIFFLFFQLCTLSFCSLIELYLFRVWVV